MILVDDAHPGLGGSDVAAILGYSPYRSPFDVWTEKTGRTSRYTNTMSEAAEWGQLLEDVVAKKYAVNRDRVLMGDGRERFAHEHMSWVTGRPDRRSFDAKLNDPRILEVKTTARHKRDEWGDPGSSDVPDRVSVQSQWYLLLTGLDVCDVAVLFGGQEYAEYTLKADAEVQAFLLAEAGKFWTDHVLADKAPEVDGSKGAGAYLAERLKTTANRIADVDGEEQREAFLELLQAQDQEKAARARVYNARHRLAHLATSQDARGLRLDSTTFRAVDMPGKVNYRGLAEELMARAQLDDAARLELSAKYVGRPSAQWRTFHYRPSGYTMASVDDEGVES
jgi:putative phage-type endonuclease